MGTRFFEQDIWSRKWFRELPAEWKAFYFYARCRCDNAGFWDVDFESASFQIGEKLSEADMPDSIAKDFVRFSPGRWWLPYFVAYSQGGALKETNRPQAWIIRRIKHCGQWEEWLRVSEGYRNGKPTHTETAEEGSKAQSQYSFFTKTDDWQMPQKLLDELVARFPEIDVQFQCRKASAWCMGNAAKRKTRRGMPKFITGWISRACDRAIADGTATTESEGEDWNRLQAKDEAERAKDKGAPDDE